MLNCNKGRIELAGNIVELTSDLTAIIDAIAEKAGISTDELLEQVGTGLRGLKLLRSGMNHKEVAEVLSGRDISQEDFDKDMDRIKKDYGHGQNTNQTN